MPGVASLYLVVAAAWLAIASSRAEPTGPADMPESPRIAALTEAVSNGDAAAPG